MRSFLDAAWVPVVRNGVSHRLFIASALSALLMTSEPAARGLCVGDCDGEGAVTIDELVLVLGMALSGASVDACRLADVDGDNAISVADMVTCVGSALNGCGPSPTPTRTPQSGIDLRPSGVFAQLSSRPCPDPTYLSVCVENAGATGSGGFEVTVQPGDDRFEIGALGAQSTACENRPFTGWEQAGVHTFTVTVDSDGRVSETDESNNTSAVQVQRPTLAPTCTQTVLPSRTGTPTPTPVQ